MPPLPNGITFTHHTAEAVPALLDEICDAYADAYGEVPGEDMGTKITAFRDRATKALERPRYELVTAQEGSTIAGFVFGYDLPTDTFWWDGLTPEPPEGFTAEDNTRTFVMAEIEVRQKWQGSGVGRALHNEMLAGRQEERATLATGPKADAARAIYERWGWQKVGTVPGKPGAYFSAYTLYVLPLPLTERR